MLPIADDVFSLSIGWWTFALKLFPKEENLWSVEAVKRRSEKPFKVGPEDGCEMFACRFSVTSLNRSELHLNLTCDILWHPVSCEGVDANEASTWFAHSDWRTLRDHRQPRCQLPVQLGLPDPVATWKQPPWSCAGTDGSWSSWSVRKSDPPSGIDPNFQTKIHWDLTSVVSVPSICYRPGSVHVRFRFLRFLIDFGSVRCLEHSAWIFVFFPGVGKANTDCFPQEVYCFPQEVSWAAAFKKWRELNPEKQISWNCQYMQFIMKKPIFVFFIELKKQLQLFQSVYWGRVRRFRFLRFGFAHGSSGLRFLRFIGYLIFYGSVPRFRFGSRTLLFNIDTWYTVLAFAPGCLVFWRTWCSFYFPLSQATDRWVCPKMGGVPIHHVDMTCHFGRANLSILDNIPVSIQFRLLKIYFKKKHVLYPPSLKHAYWGVVHHPLKILIPLSRKRVPRGIHFRQNDCLGQGGYAFILSLHVPPIAHEF